jgi:nitroreductase
MILMALLANNVITAIRNRRSIRKYTKDPISDEQITVILEAGRWAPSGLNNQPWSFLIIRDRQKLECLAQLTKYGRIIKNSQACICVFYTIPDGYNRDKDLLSIGACIQNMLLAAHATGIGSVWLGEILNRKNEVNDIFIIDNDHELMAVIALGKPAEIPRSSRKNINTLILKKI